MSEEGRQADGLTKGDGDERRKEETERVLIDLIFWMVELKYILLYLCMFFPFRSLMETLNQSNI